MGSSLSVLGFLAHGASMSLRGFARIGSALSVLDYVNLGSSLSVRSLVRFGSAVAEDRISFGDTNSYTKYVSSPSAAIETFVNNNRALSATATGGILHGTWISDDPVIGSDRRLKKSIVPLYKAIAAETANKAASGPSHSTGSEKASTVGWVLRQLRPVSFKFKHGPESKHSRYGFVAQELQQVLPAVVRGQGDRHLSVAYQDMIALLTLAAQVLQDRVNQQEESIASIMKYIKALDEKIESVLTKQQEKVRAGGDGALTVQIQKLEEKLERVLLQQQRDEASATKRVREPDGKGERIEGWPHAVQI